MVYYRFVVNTWLPVCKLQSFTLVPMGPTAYVPVATITCHGIVACQFSMLWTTNNLLLKARQHAVLGVYVFHLLIK